MSVDKNGLDMVNLKCSDYNRFRPKVICAETLVSSSTKVRTGNHEFMATQGHVIRGGSCVSTVLTDSKLIRPAGKAYGAEYLVLRHLRAQHDLVPRGRTYAHYQTYFLSLFHRRHFAERIVSNDSPRSRLATYAYNDDGASPRSGTARAVRSNCTARLSRKQGRSQLFTPVCLQNELRPNFRFRSGPRRTSRSFCE
jgi:hypothetical protein